MTNPQFQAKIRPTLSPEAQRLVDIYDATPGSSGPYCCPEGLAAVLDEIAGFGAGDVYDFADQLRGNP